VFFRRRAVQVTTYDPATNRWNGVDDAHAVAARVRAAVSASPVLASHAHGSVGLTVSIGLAASETAALEPDDLVGRADAACYRAKASGRDAIAV